MGRQPEQPDAGSPDRLIGICEDCRHWYLLDLMPDEGAAVMVLLPDPGPSATSGANQGANSSGYGWRRGIGESQAEIRVGLNYPRTVNPGRR
jgi:hypothetical protein